jgi:hypothetical protein
MRIVIAFLAFILVGCVKPTNVYVPSPTNTCTTFAKHYDAVPTPTPSNSTELLSQAGLPSADATMLWYLIADDAILLCIYEPPDGCGSRSRVFRVTAGVWQIQDNKGHDRVCLIH